VPPLTAGAAVSAVAAAAAAATMGSVNTEKQPPPGQTYGGAISVLESGVRESRWHMIV